MPPDRPGLAASGDPSTAAGTPDQPTPSSDGEPSRQPSTGRQPARPADPSVRHPGCQRRRKRPGTRAAEAGSEAGRAAAAHRRRRATAAASSAARAATGAALRSGSGASSSLATSCRCWRDGGATDRRGSSRRGGTLPAEAPGTVRPPRPRPEPSRRCGQPQATADQAEPVQDTPRSQARPGAVKRIVRKIDPWSVLKISLLFYSALFLILCVASTVLWNVARDAGTVEQIENFITESGGFGNCEAVERPSPAAPPRRPSPGLRPHPPPQPHPRPPSRTSTRTKATSAPRGKSSPASSSSRTTASSRPRFSAAWCSSSPALLSPSSWPALQPHQRPHRRSQDDALEEETAARPARPDVAAAANVTRLPGAIAQSVRAHL